MPSAIVKKVSSEVKKACRKKSNFFGPSVWETHIVPVVTHAKTLAQKLNADQEICELSALLHDYASILKKEWCQEHDLRGAVLAEEILRKYSCSQEKIEKVKHCILTHRGSKKIPRKTLEAKILASADAMSHFDHVDVLFHLAFVNHKMNIEQGTIWVMEKLENSYQKLMPQAKKMVEEKYRITRKLFHYENL